MIKIRDLSVRKRLLFSNFIMVAVPVFLLLFIGGIILGGLRLTGNAKEKELALLFPDSGTSLSLHMSLNRLRTQLDHSTHNTRKLETLYDQLEAQGMKLVITRNDDLLYETEPGSLVSFTNEVQKQHSADGSVFLWDDEKVIFRYASPKTNMQVIAIGDIPFSAKDLIFPPGFKDIVETIGLIIILIAIFIIIIIGIYLSRWLSHQIVTPLEKLRYTAGEISKGNLDYSLTMDSHDELGDTCREFEKMRIQLKTAQDTREKYEHNRRELIAGISHDLSTPLTRVKGYTSGLIDGIANTPEKKQHYLDMIYQTSISMEKLVSSLFLFSKLELGQTSFHWERVDLSAYLADFINESQAIWQSRGLDITFSDTAVNGTVMMDRLQFQRVVSNLIENSLKYKDTPRGTLTISLSNNDAEHICLDFADEGIGVVSADLIKLFDSFYRTDPARTNVSNGSGLGLAIVKQIVLGMKGQIQALQTVPKGLTIRIYLPVAKEDSHEENINH